MSFRSFLLSRFPLSYVKVGITLAGQPQGTGSPLEWQHGRSNAGAISPRVAQDEWYSGAGCDFPGFLAIKLRHFSRQSEPPRTAQDGGFVGFMFATEWNRRWIMDWTGALPVSKSSESNCGRKLSKKYEGGLRNYCPSSWCASSSRTRSAKLSASSSWKNSWSQGILLRMFSALLNASFNWIRFGLPSSK